MEKHEGIIDFEREEELTLEEQEKVVRTFQEGKKMRGSLSCIADGNFVQFEIQTKNPERPVVKFTTDFTTLVGLIQELGFEVPMSDKEPSEKEKKQIEEDAKHDGYKVYLEESKEDIID